MPISASRQVGHWKISGCLCDGCRLVHPVRQFIRYHSIHIYDGFRLMNPVLIIIHIHSVFKYHISIPYSLSYYLFKDILNLCSYIMYSFMYSFHSYLVNYQFTRNKNRVRELTEAVESSFLLFDHHPSLVNNNHATLSG